MFSEASFSTGAPSSPGPAVTTCQQFSTEGIKTPSNKLTTHLGRAQQVPPLHTHLAEQRLLSPILAQMTQKSCRSRSTYGQPKYRVLQTRKWGQENCCGPPSEAGPLPRTSSNRSRRVESGSSMRHMLHGLPTSKSWEKSWGLMSQSPCCFHGNGSQHLCL